MNLKTISGILRNDWHAMRLIRLGLGIVIAFQAFQMKDGCFAILAALVIFQALSNTGCAGGSCAIPKAKTRQATNN